MNPFAAIDDITLVATDDGTVYAIDHDGPHPTNLTVEQVTDWNLYELAQPTIEQIAATGNIWSRTAALSPHLQERGLWNDPGSGRFVRRGWSSLKWLLSLQNREQRLWKQARELDEQGSPVDVFLTRPTGGITPTTPLRVREVFDQGTGNRAGKLRVDGPDGRSFLVRWDNVREVVAGQQDNQQIDLVEAVDTEPLVDERIARLTAADFVSGDAFRAATAGLVHTPDDADVQDLKQPVINNISGGFDTLTVDLEAQTAMLARFPLVDVMVEAVNAAISSGSDTDSAFIRRTIIGLLTGSTRSSLRETQYRHSSLTQLMTILDDVMNPYVGGSESNFVQRLIADSADTADGSWLNKLFPHRQQNVFPHPRLISVAEDAPSHVFYGQPFVGSDGGIRYFDRTTGVQLLVDADGEPLREGDTVYLYGRIEATVVHSSLDEREPRILLVPRASNSKIPPFQLLSWSESPEVSLWTRSPIDANKVLLKSSAGSQLSVGDRVGTYLGDGSLPDDGIVVDIVTNNDGDGDLTTVVVIESSSTGARSTVNALTIAPGIYRVPTLGNAELENWMATRPLEFSGADTTGRIPAARQLAELLIRSWADAQDSAAATTQAVALPKFVPPADRSALRGADLRDRSLPASAQIAMALLSSVNGAWANSSQTTVATGLQYAAAELAGSNAADFRDWQKFIRANSAFREIRDSQLILTRPVALSTYLLTQQTLRDQGIGSDDMLLLWRGDGSDEWLIANHMHAPTLVRTNPLSATSTDASITTGFGRVQLGMRVPASHLFSTAHTGPGTYSESEALVLGSPDDGFVTLAWRSSVPDANDVRTALTEIKAGQVVDAASWASYPADSVRWFGSLFGERKAPESAAVRLASYLNGGLVAAYRDQLRLTGWADEVFPALDDDAGWTEWAARLDAETIVNDVKNSVVYARYGSDHLRHSRPWNSPTIRADISTSLALKVADTLFTRIAFDPSAQSLPLSLAQVLFTHLQQDEPPVVRQVLHAVPREQRPEMLNDMISEMFQLGERLAPDALLDRVGESIPELISLDRATVRAAIGDMLATALIQTVLPELVDGTGRQLDWKYRPGDGTARVPMFVSPPVDGRRYVMRTNAPPDAEDPASMHWWETSWVEASATGDELIWNYDSQSVVRNQMQAQIATVSDLRGRSGGGQSDATRSPYGDTPVPVRDWILNLSWPELLQMIRDPASFADKYALAFGDTVWFKYWPFDRLLTELFQQGVWADLRFSYMRLGDLQAEADKLLEQVQSSFDDELVAA